MMADYALTNTAGLYGLTVAAGKVAEVNTLENPDGIAEMIQRITIAIKTHLGEVLLNTDLGLPWKEQILVKNPNLGQISSGAKAYLLTIEGVTGIRQLDIALNTVTRIMTWTLNVETTAGVTGPFNLTNTV